MKTLKVISFFAFLITSQFVIAQKKEMNQMLSNYYGIKNALIAEDEKTTRNNATDFLKTLETFPVNDLSTSQLKTWKEHASKMKTEAEYISKISEVEKQRDHLNSLSEHFFSVVKVLNMNDQTIYKQYCPMKKAYWLSSDKDIKNPYYGKKMLTCGSVKETVI